MQTITHDRPHIHPIFGEFDRVYAEMSQKQAKKTLVPIGLDVTFKPLVDMFRKYGWQGETNYTEKTHRTLKSSKKRKEVIICFSGGKDSTATAVHYKEKGYSVILYHLHGINKMYKDEYLSASKVAEDLDLPLMQEEVTITGWVQPDWIEHPMKNMIIANRAIQFALRHKMAPRIAFGNFSTSTLDNDPFEVCGGDCREMWQIYRQIMEPIIPNMHIETPLENMQSTLDILFKHQELIDNIQSCIIPFHYKQRLRKRHAEKYAYKLPPNRCGSCWKCAVEYIVYCDNDIWEYDEVWYEHCLEVLRNTLKKEQSIVVSALKEVWPHYFFYDISKSRYFSCKN